MNRLTTGAACALLILAAGLARAQDKEVNLVRTVKEGDTVRHKVTITASVMGMEVIVVQNSKAVAKKINDKGHIVWENASEGGSVTVGGTEQPQDASPAGTETRDKYNKLIDYKAPETAQEIMSPEVQKLVANSSEVIFSEKPVKAGDSWSTDAENPVVKDKKFSIKTTFVGLDKVEGKEYWKVKQEVSADVDKDGGKTSSEFTAWLDPADGSTFKMEGTVKDLPTMFGPLSWTM